MTVVYGNQVAYHTTNALSAVYYQAQIVYTLTYPTDSTYKIEWEFRTYHPGTLYDSYNKGGCNSGSLHGATTWSNKKYSDSSASYKSYASGTKEGSRSYSSTISITQEFWIEGLAENSGIIKGGGRSTAKMDINVAKRPAAKPSKPGTPTATSVDQDGAKINMTLPASNGAEITDTGFWIFTQASGGTAVATDGKENTNTAWTANGLNAGTDYWAEVAAKNSVGWSDRSARVKFTTSAANKPSQPSVASISSITKSSATATGSAPATNGSTITGYQWQVATDENFANVILDKTQSSLTLSITGLSTYKRYYVRYRANSNVGSSSWADDATFLTSADVPNKPGKPVADPIQSDRATITLPAASTRGSAVTGIQLQVSADPAFGSTVYDVTNLTSTREVTSLVDGTEYFMRQRANSALGYSDWSDVSSFIAESTSDIWVNQSGTWKIAEPWLNVAGVWKRVEFWQNDSGTWKKVA